MYKMWHPEDPPPRFFKAQKTRGGGGIFHVVRWNISQKFLALPPPKYSRVKGGGIGTTCPTKTLLLMNLESEMHSHIFPPFFCWFPSQFAIKCSIQNGSLVRSTSPCRHPSDKIALSDSARTPRSASSARSLRSCWDDPAMEYQAWGLSSSKFLYKD